VKRVDLNALSDAAGANASKLEPAQQRVEINAFHPRSRAGRLAVPPPTTEGKYRITTYF
jgi:hypothetical protein